MGRGEKVRLSARLSILAECRIVSLVQRIVFLWRFTHLCAAFPGKNFVWCNEATREETTRWAKLTVRQLSHI
jgi:hypothetical protein